MADMTSASPTPASKPKPRPRPQVMRLTDAAALRITELTTRADSAIVGLRVGVKNGGCAGQSYTVEYAHEVRPTDEVVEDRGVKIRSEEHTSELQSQSNLVCRLLLEKKKKKK